MAISWDRMLETGIPLIDMQHKELVKQVDSLLDINRKSRFQETLRFLEKYIPKHFADEEKMQGESKYPKAALHKGYHDKFVTTFGQLKEKFEKQGETASNNMELHRVAMGWLKDHILVHDKEFAEYYKSQKRP